MESRFHPWSDCSTCKFYDMLNNTCVAFPAKIPVSIYGNYEKHSVVRADQEGTWVYETAQWAIDAKMKLNRPTRQSDTNDVE